MLPPALLAVSYLPLLLVTHACFGMQDQERLGMDGRTVDVSVSVSLNSADESPGAERVACAWGVWRKRYV